MKKIVHKAESRGFADHGWLKSHHSFSFASYFNPERMGFGLLRVLNDDRVSASQGFDTHPHKNMEIVSVPLKGSLRHKDSEGNETVIRKGEVQIMSAGTGVYHSEYNHSDEEEVNFLQIWILPEALEIPPRYDQKLFSESGRDNRFQEIVSPLGSTKDSVKINQQAYFSLADLSKDKTISYRMKSSKNGLYLFIIGGSLEVSGESLNERDAIGIQEVESVELRAVEQSQILAIEVPMV